MENPYESPTTDADALEPTGPGGRELATRGSRLGAVIIDAIIVGPLAFLANLALPSVISPTGEIAVGPAEFILLQLVGLAIGIAIYLAINGYLLANNGQTVGKKLLGIRIVQESDGQIMPLMPLVLKRYLPFWLVSAIPFVNLINLIDALLIFRENRHCLHDDFASTIVVKA